MINRIELDRKYKEIAELYNVSLSVIHQNEGYCYNDAMGVIMINDTLVADLDYETYLSYGTLVQILSGTELQTDRLVVRRMREEDQGDLFVMLSDRETCYMDGGYEPFASVESESFKWLMDDFLVNPFRLVVESKENHKVIGILHVLRVNRSFRHLALGYVIAKEYRRNGYGYEAASRLIHLLLNELEIETLELGIARVNEPSIKLAEKLGFTYAGIYENAYSIPGIGKVDELCYVKHSDRKQ